MVKYISYCRTSVWLLVCTCSYFWQQKMVLRHFKLLLVLLLASAQISLFFGILPIQISEVYVSEFSKTPSTAHKCIGFLTICLTQDVSISTFERAPSAFPSSVLQIIININTFNFYSLFCVQYWDEKHEPYYDTCICFTYKENETDAVLVRHKDFP